VNGDQWRERRPRRAAENFLRRFYGLDVMRGARPPGYGDDGWSDPDDGLEDGELPLGAVL
jgi:hypothetical protein